MPAPADRITSIVEQAVLLERNDRTRFLDETCQDDELRRMVDAVLAEIDRPLILDRPVDEAAAHLFCDNQPTMVGTRIGPYRIESLLGAGGMGQVYRATDSRLGRQVAIKTLPPMLAGDPDRVARFERESKVLAALNHPHIAAIYGIETDGAGAALVLELVEGQTLEEILTRGALPLDEALALCRQLADALDAAHQMGIVHRDLKPGNIKVREDGTLKVLDFGLAKLAQPDVAPAAAADPSRSPTIATPAMTTAGMILGTAAYMAPEQARGKPVDKRADIFAFGAVLYEMLTGRRAFPGDDVAETLAAVVKSEPDWTAVPAALRPLLQRCLEKDPRRRLRDIGDAVPALEPGNAAVERHDRPSRGPWMAAAAAAIVAVLAVGVARVSWRNAAVSAARYAELAPEDGWQIDTSTGTTAARGGSALVISPNGRYVAQMVSHADGASGVVIRDLQTGREQHIADTRDASSLFWKPDSSMLAFVAGGALRKVSADGGAVSLIAPVASGGMGVVGATWGPDDTIVFAAGYSGRGGLTRVSAAGGTANDAVPPATDRSETGVSMPWFLPDGRHILYTALILGASNDRSRRLYVQALGSPERQVLGTVGARNVQYAAGHLLYVDGDRTLMARPFDPARRMFTGEPTPVAEQVRTRVALGGFDAFFSVSEAGTLVYQAGPGLAVQLTVKDRSGNALRTLGVPGAIREVTLAHDERRAAVMVGTAIWIYDLDEDRGQRLQLPEASVGVIWSPDDTQIAFGRVSPGGATVGDIFRKDLKSATPEEPLLVAEDFQIPADWRSDRLFFGQGPGPFGNNDIWVLPLAGTRRPYPLVQTPHNDSRPQVSPNGRFFAYVTDDTGRFQVYVAPLPDPPDDVGTTSSTFLPGRTSVSTNGGTNPRWRGDGRELYFVDSAAGMIMAASVDTSQGRITVGRPQPLFPIATDALAASEYDVFSDGQRFLVRVPHTPETTLATIVFNWTALVHK